MRTALGGKEKDTVPAGAIPSSKTQTLFLLRETAAPVPADVPGSADHSTLGWVPGKGSAELKMSFSDGELLSEGWIKDCIDWLGLV